MVPTCFQYILCCGASAIYNYIVRVFVPTAQNALILILFIVY